MMFEKKIVKLIFQNFIYREGAALLILVLTFLDLVKKNNRFIYI